MVISMDRWRGKVAVVTGASAGIGAAIEEGLQVVGLARRVERVQKLAKTLSQKKGKLHAVQTDIQKPDDIIKAFKWIKDNVGPVHILINNAGVGSNTTLIDGDIENWKMVLDTNVFGLCVATREGFSSMLENNVDGHIIHINSECGHKVPTYPNTSVYSASKFAVTALSETLRGELKAIGNKTKITSISPGLVHTEFLERCDLNWTPEFIDSLKNLGQTAGDIADHIIYVLSTPPHVQINELSVQGVGE